MKLMSEIEGECPYCESDDLEHDYTKADETRCYVTCNICGKEFIEVHQLSFAGYYIDEEVQT